MATTKTNSLEKLEERAAEHRNAVKEDTHKLLDETSEVIEDTLQVLEDTTKIAESRLSWLLKDRKAQLIFTGVVATAIGATVGYWVAVKRLKPKYQLLADEQVEDVKKHYSILRKEGEYSDPGVLAARYQDETEEVATVLNREGYTSYDQVEPAVESETVVIEETTTVVEADIPDVHLFESDNPETFWDWDEEKEKRAKKPNDPYLITLDEFNLNEPDYQQVTLTFYEGDEVLVDEKDQPIEDDTKVVGSDATIRFGHGSNDRNTVYVCNPRLELYFEIVRNDKKYAEEVLGFIEHSADNRLRKFRNYD